MSIRGFLVRSSFGLNAKQSMSSIYDYVDAVLKDEGLSADVSFEHLGVRKHAQTRCVFDDYDVPSYHEIKLGSNFFEDKLTRGLLDVVFTYSAVAAGHEIEHVRQFESKDVELALCHLAAVGNPQNYKLNYWYNQREILAEYSGLKFAESYFESCFPNVDGKSLLLDYANSRADEFGTRDDDRMYWIMKSSTGDFASLSEVYSAFESAYEERFM